MKVMAKVVMAPDPLTVGIKHNFPVQEWGPMLLRPPKGA